MTKYLPTVGSPPIGKPKLFYKLKLFYKKPINLFLTLNFYIKIIPFSTEEENQLGITLYTYNLKKI